MAMPVVKVFPAPKVTLGMLLPLMSSRLAMLAVSPAYVATETLPPVTLMTNAVPSNLTGAKAASAELPAELSTFITAPEFAALIFSLVDPEPPPFTGEPRLNVVAPMLRYDEAVPMRPVYEASIFNAAKVTAD